MKRIDRLFYVIFFTTLAVFAWASLYELDQVVRGEARVSPEGNAMEIKARFSGEVKSVNINLGDRVTAGQLLFKVDPEGADIDVEKLLNRLRYLRAIELRLQAQVRSKPLEFNAYIDHLDAAAQRLIYESSLKDLEALKQIRETRSRTFDVNREAALQSVANLERQLALIQREIAILNELVGAQAESELTLVQAQLRRAELQERLDAAQQESERLILDKALADTEITQEINRIEGQWRQLLSETSAEIGTLREDIAKALRLESLRTITSPADAIVSKLYIQRPGQLARDADPLAELVPINSNFKVIAKISPSDISNIRIGQTARLSLQSFDFAKYGHIDLRVETIAQNLVEPQNAPPYFEVHLSITKQVFSKTGESVELIPGLLGSVDILNEPVTVLEYLTTPIRRGVSLALTEG